MLNIYEYKKIHFIGIGGVSMSAIASSLFKKGFIVSGSDKSESYRTKELENMGIKIYYTHSSDNVKNVDAVVYTGAISDDNPEFIFAKENNIPLLRRTEALNVFLDGHKYNIAISGTHGKTTTSSMITAILEEAGKKPDFFIGANIPSYNTTHRLENSEYLVLEACEYQASFLDFDPNTIIVNNIDYDHVDYYDDIYHVYNTFSQFVKKLDDKGILIVNGDDKHAVKLLEEKKNNSYSFGVENESDFMAKNIDFTSNEKVTYDFYFKGEKKCEIVISILGMQNVYNSLAAFAASYLNGVDLSLCSKALLKYKNASRRFEMLKTKGDAVLISDYAHHPSEIIATLKTAKLVHKSDVVVIFQPHTYSRTKKLLAELIESFDFADKIYIADIDPVRERDIYNISSKDIVDGLVLKNKNAEYLGSLDNLKDCINQNLCNQNMVIAMGAGAIDKYARLV